MAAPRPRDRDRGRAEQIRNDGAIAQQLQEQEVVAASSIPFIPPVVPSETSDDDDDDNNEQLQAALEASRLDRNGAFTPVPFHRRFPPNANATAAAPAATPAAYNRFPPRPVIPPVVPPPPERPFIPPVVPLLGPVIPPTPRASPVVPPTPRARDRVTFAPEPPRPAPPRPRPVIPPFPTFAGARRAMTPVPQRPMYWYPPGVTPQPVYYPRLPPGAVVPAPPIPPIVRPRMQSPVCTPPPKKPDQVVVPFIPPMPEEKKTKEDVPKKEEVPKSILKEEVPKSILKEEVPKPILKPKPVSAVKAVERERTRAVNSAVKPTKPTVERAVESLTDTDTDLQSGPLYDLRKHVGLFTGSFRCTTCAAEVQPKPIHKDLGVSGPLASLGTHLHLICAACSTMYCRGCRRTPHCKRTCTAGPTDKCFLKTCCRAGRAIAVFSILACFDAHFLRLARTQTYLAYIKQTLSAPSPTQLSALLTTTLTALLSWLPIAPSPSTSAPHVHASIAPLLRTSLLLDVLRLYLRAPRAVWVSPAHAGAHGEQGGVYKLVLVFLQRLEEVGRGAVKGLVFARRRGVGRTKGVGRVVWALAEKGKGVGWTAGDEQESFSELLSREKLRVELQDMKDRAREEAEERRVVLDHFLGQLLRWRMADALK